MEYLIKGRLYTTSANPNILETRMPPCRIQNLMVEGTSKNSFREAFSGKTLDSIRSFLGWQEERGH